MVQTRTHISFRFVAFTLRIEHVSDIQVAGTHCQGRTRCRLRAFRAESGSRQCWAQPSQSHTAGADLIWQGTVFVFKHLPVVSLQVYLRTVMLTVIEQGLPERDEAPPVKIVLDNLPPEVLHVIFQHAAHADKPTILACSLVSWNWREMSLPHLFSSLTVKRSLDYDDFSNFLTEHPNLARYIRRLVLGFLPKRYFDGLPHATIRPTLTSVNLSQITAKLPRLHTLVLQSVWLAEAQGDIASLPSVIPRMLEGLMIHGCSAPREEPLPLRALLGILITYPATAISLQSIFVVDCNAPIQFDTELSSATHQSTIRLDLGSSCDHWPRLYETFRRLLAPRCLRSLCTHPNIHDAAPDVLRALGAFIDHAGGEALRHLELPFSIGVDDVGHSQARPGEHQEKSLSPLTRSN